VAKNTGDEDVQHALLRVLGANLRRPFLLSAMLADAAPSSLMLALMNSTAAVSAGGHGPACFAPVNQ